MFALHSPIETPRDSVKSKFLSKSQRDIVLDPAAYQQVADQLDILSKIRRGLTQAKRDEGQTVDEVFDELEMEA